jgi:uncharacterized protein
VPSPTPRRVSRRRFLKVAGGVALAAGGVGYWQMGEAHKLLVERRTLALPRWSADGFRIAFLTDNHLHSERTLERALRAVDLAAQEKPDLILIGGDTVDLHNRQTPGYITRYFDAVRQTKIPALQTVGNHDYWCAYPEEILRMLKDSGVPLLRNQVREVEGVHILGIDDGIMGRDKHDTLAARHDKNVIAVFHEPDFVDRIDRRASLMLAGHSHGGQIKAPFFDAIKLPRGARKYVEGYFPQTPVPLYVSRGVGTGGPDVRLFCPPEVTILTLVSA